jgi:hypothetical protein
VSEASDLIEYEDTVLHVAWKATGAGESTLGRIFVTNSEAAATTKYVELANPWLTKATAALNAKAGSAYELAVLQNLYVKILGRRDEFIRLGYGSATPSGEEKIVEAGKKLLAGAADKLDLEKYLRYAVAILVVWLCISFVQRRGGGL